MYTSHTANKCLFCENMGAYINIKIKKISLKLKSSE